MVQTIKKLTHKLVLLLSIISLSVGVQLGTVSAAGSGYAASDVYGQLTGGNPDLTTVAYGGGDSGFNYASGTALDTVHHRLFVSDYYGNRVLVFALNSNNAPASRHAVHVLGQANFTDNGFSSSQSGMFHPYAALVYDSVNNRLFVSDAGNSRVLVYNLAGGITDGMNASYVIGQTGFGVADQVASRAGMSDPEGLAFDPMHERLFVSDYSYARVTVYDVTPGAMANGMNASYVLGQANFTDSVEATTQNGMNTPEAIAYNPKTQQLFVGDSGNDRVLVFGLANGISNHMNASYVLGEPDFTTTNTSNTVNRSSMGNYIEGMGIDSDSNILYVYDDTFNRIMVYNLAGGITNGMDASAVIGQVDFTSNDYGCPDPSSGETLCDAEGTISVDPANGRLFVPDADDNRVLVYNLVHFTKAAGKVATVAAGSHFSMKLDVAGARGTLQFSITSGALPPGLSLNASTGVISGTPTKAGTYTFEAAVSDDNGDIGIFTQDPSYTITVTSASGASSNGNIPNAPNTGYGQVAYSGPSTAVWLISVASMASGFGLLYTRRKSLRSH